MNTRNRQIHRAVKMFAKGRLLHTVDPALVEEQAIAYFDVDSCLYKYVYHQDGLYAKVATDARVVSDATFKHKIARVLAKLWDNANLIRRYRAI